MEISVEKLQKVKLEKDEILIVQFDETKWTNEDLKNAHLACKAVFTKNKVIFIPTNVTLSVMQNPDNYNISSKVDNIK